MASHVIPCTYLHTSTCKSQNIINWFKWPFTIISCFHNVFHYHQCNTTLRFFFFACICVCVCVCVFVGGISQFDKQIWHILKDSTHKSSLHTLMKILPNRLKFIAELFCSFYLTSSGSQWFSVVSNTINPVLLQFPLHLQHRRKR